nr:recombinase family protein [Streptosporangium roseum]
MAERPELARCLEYLRPVDTLVVWRLDRLGRSLRHLVETVNQCAVTVVQEEEPPKVRLRHRIAVAAVCRRFLITEELHRHGWNRRSEPPQDKQ